jgi:hypothetical protein
VNARDFECTNIKFNNSSGYAYGIVGASTNVKLNNTMTLGNSGYVYTSNATFNWSSTLQTSPNDATDGKIVWYFNNFNPKTNPEYFKIIKQNGQIYFTGSRQIQFNTVDDKVELQGEVHYGIDGFTAVNDGVHENNAKIEFALRRKNGEYGEFRDLEVSELQKALAELPSDVLKSCQMKLTIEKVNDNPVGVTQPDISVTVDDAVVVPVYGLWGETYFPEAGETISTAYNRVIFQESGSYNATVKLPFVDVLNGSTVALNADDAPEVLAQTDGTIILVLPEAEARISNIVVGSRLLVYNETKILEGTDGLVFNHKVTESIFSLTYENGTAFRTGDTARIVIEYQNGLTAKQTFRTNAVAGSLGWSVLAEQENDDIYIGYNHDGSTLQDKFKANYEAGTIELKDGLDPLVSELYSWFVWNKSEEDGIHTGGILTAEDSANIVLSDMVLIDNITEKNVLFGDNRRLYRKDGVFPAKRDPSGGGGISLNWRNTIIIVETGVSGLTASEAITHEKIDAIHDLVDVAVSSRSSIEPDNAAITYIKNNVDVPVSSRSSIEPDNASIMDIKNNVDVPVSSRSSIEPDNASIMDIKKRTGLIPALFNGNF